jgi:hypothetical protein
MLTRVEPIFEAVLANDSSEIAAIAARTPSAITQRMEQDVLITELPHMLYRGDTPLHLAAAGLRFDAARALLAAGIPIDAVNRRGATAFAPCVRSAAGFNMGPGRATADHRAVDFPWSDG